MYKHGIMATSAACAAALLMLFAQTRTVATLVLVALSITLMLEIEALFLRASRGIRRTGPIAVCQVGIGVAIVGNLLAFYSYQTETYWLSFTASLTTLLGFASAGLGLPRLIWREFREGR